MSETKEFARKRAEEVLGRHPELRTIPGVMNTRVATKWVEGKDTGAVSINLYVFKKKKLKGLKKTDRAPTSIEGIPIDIIELSSPDFKLTDTWPSRQPPEIQRRIAGGVRK